MDLIQEKFYLMIVKKIHLERIINIKSAKKPSVNTVWNLIREVMDRR